MYTQLTLELVPSGLRVTELKEKLAAAGKLVSGTKATLIARLLGTEPTLSCSNKVCAYCVSVIVILAIEHHLLITRYRLSIYEI